MKKFILALSVLAVVATSTLPARADDVGAVFGAGTGFAVAGPIGALLGAIIGGIFGQPFWGPHDPYACWIDTRFHRHCPPRPRYGSPPPRHNGVI